MGIIASEFCRRVREDEKEFEVDLLDAEELDLHVSAAVTASLRAQIGFVPHLPAQFENPRKRARLADVLLGIQRSTQRDARPCPIEAGLFRHPNVAFAVARTFDERRAA